jgi:hypothetical protein
MLLLLPVWPAYARAVAYPKLRSIQVRVVWRSQWVLTW